MKFDTLYTKGKTGALYQWNVWTEGAEIVTEYGQIDGKMQYSRKKAVGKNPGKKNGTTNEQQADKEALALWTFKLERKYSKTPDAAQEPLMLPMLAHNFKKRKTIDYPIDIQRKYNGVRCLASWVGNRVRLLSRGGKEYNVPAVQKELESFLPSDCVLDGELYVHGPSLQTINSWIKREQPNTAKIEYHVYDCPEFNGADKPWSERKLDLMSVFLLASNCPRIVVAETFVAYNLDDVVMFEKQFVDEGFEGVIARVQNGLYTFGHRSNDLLKYKSFMDAEYKIVGYYTGVGKWADCPTWVCEMENGKQFGAPPKGSMEFRRQLLRDADSYIGKWLVVKFFAYTDDGIPQFPVGIAIRMEEDMDPLG